MMEMKKDDKEAQEKEDKAERKRRCCRAYENNIRKIGKQTK